METSPEQIEADARLIKALGGPAKVATLLGWPNPAGQRRVTNWRKRGIPPLVKLAHPFLVGQTDLLTKVAAPAPAPRPLPCPPPWPPSKAAATESN